MSDPARADPTQSFPAAFAPVMRQLIELTSASIRQDAKKNNISAVRGRLQQFADGYDVDIDFSDYTLDEAVEFNEHLLLSVLDQDDADYEGFDGAEAIDIAHAAVLLSRAEREEREPASDEAIDAAVKSYQRLTRKPLTFTEIFDDNDEIETGEGDLPDGHLSPTERCLIALKEEMIERLAKEQGEQVASEIESYGLDHIIRLMNEGIGEVAALDFSGFSAEQVTEFTKYLVEAYLEDGEDADIVAIAEEAFDYATSVFPFDPSPHDVSDEFYRIYTYRDHNTGFCYSVNVLYPVSLTVGEDGEHIFELSNRTTQILPGDFLDVDVIYRGAEEEREAA